MQLIMPEIVPETYENKWVKDLMAELYHADKTAISSSSLKNILTSEHHFYYYWKKAQKTGEKKKAEPRHFRIGHALHAAILEPELFKKLYITEPEFIGKTKDGKDSKSCNESKKMKEEWVKTLHPMAIVLTEKDLNELHEMIDSVLSHNYACALLKTGVPEISGYYRDPQTGIKCRIRPDFMNFVLDAMIDVKTTKSCYKRGFQRSIVDFLYNLQVGMYSTGISHINGKAPESIAFLAVQNCEPYEVALYEADATVRETGEKLYRKALNQLSVCLSKNAWARYQTGIEPIALPDWYLKTVEEGALINEY